MHVPLLTTEALPGRRVHPLGLLLECETLGLHAGRDLLVRLTDFFGGRSQTVDYCAQRALERAATRLRERAATLGAVAVLGVRIHLIPVGLKGTGMVQAVIYGTAVAVEQPEREATGRKSVGAGEHPD